MSEVFEICESNFYNSLRIAQKYLSTSTPTQGGLQEVEEALTDATQELNKMEVEYTLERRPVVKDKIDLFKDQLRSYKKRLSAQQQLHEEMSQHSGPLFDEEAHERVVNPLIEAKRQMYENEAISNQVAQNMKKNNEVLIKNINRMDDINSELTVAHKLLNSIKEKMRKNKLILYGVLAFLFLVIAVIAYSFFTGASKKL